MGHEERADATMQTTGAPTAPRQAGDTHGRAGNTARLAWSLWAIAVGCNVGAAAFHVASRTTLLGEPVVVALLSGISLLLLATTALIITLRRSENTVGWLLAVAVLGLAAQEFAAGYGHYALTHPDTLPGGRLVALLQPVGVVGLVALALAFLVFPTGHLPSPRWRPVAWALVAVGGLLFAAFVLTPGPLLTGVPASENPLGVAALRTVNLIDPLYTLFLGLVLLALISLLFRFRRARGDERQQLKWLPVGVALVLASFLIEDLGNPTLNALADLFAVGALSGAILVAILKYRLYDIDRILNRTLVYTVLTVLLGVVYAVGVFVLSRLLDPADGESELAVAASTLAVAALSQPLRRRVQAAVDRRFNRRRFDAAKTVETFSVRLRDEIDLDMLSAELLTVVDQTMQPTAVSLWLQPSAPRLSRAARATS
jgi:hypothetical protein